MTSRLFMVHDDDPFCSMMCCLFIVSNIYHMPAMIPEIQLLSDYTDTSMSVYINYLMQKYTSHRKPKIIYQKHTCK